MADADADAIALTSGEALLCLTHFQGWTPI